MHALPAYGELPPDPRRGPPKGAPARLVTAARREAVLALGILVALGAVGGAALGHPAAWGTTALAAFGAAVALGLLAIGERRFGRRRPRFPLPAGAALGAALVLAVAAAAAAGDAPVPPAAAVALAFAPLVAAVAGLRLHATALALDTGGAGPRRAPLARALHVDDAADALVARRMGVARLAARLGALAARGLGAGALVVVEDARVALARARARVSSRTTVLVHAKADLAALAQAAAARGHAAQAWGGVLVLAPALAAPRRADGEADAPDPEHAVRVTRARLTVPDVPAADALLLVGEPKALRRVRRLVEHELAHVCVFTWCAEARRLERRLNALADDVAAAATVEERSLLLQEVARLETLAVHRAWTGEESHILVGKLHRLRASLQDALLHDPVGVKDARRQVAPGPVVAPDLGALVESGGLAAIRSVTYVAYWIVPLDTASGEWEIAVNATTNRFDREETTRVLDAIAERGATYFVESQRVQRFVPPPAEPEALLGEVRRAVREDLRLAKAWIDPALADLVYVPFVETPDGRFVNAVTGKDSPDVREALPPVLPRGTLVH